MNAARRMSRLVSIWVAALFGSTVGALDLSSFPKKNDAVTRRSAFAIGGSTLASSLLISNPASAVETSLPLQQPSEALDFSVYKVVPDASSSLAPFLQGVKKDSFVTKLAKSQGGAVWLGEHHNAAPDHNLQADILRQLSRQRRQGKVAVGLEQVQVQFQPALDDYIAGRISALEMQTQVKWEERWTWSFAVYEPVFAAAKELGVQLVALNADTEDFSLVERGGFPGLSRERLKLYIPDGAGFAEFATKKEFTTYVNYVIRPSYDMHQNMGLLKRTMAGELLDEDMPFRNFFSSRILWDEAMATAAFRWTKDNPGGLLVGLVGCDHVKFRNGIPARYSRMVGDTADCITVMLNPTPVDTRSSRSMVRDLESISSVNPDLLTLQLRYLKDGVDPDSDDRALASSTGGVLPLADYLVMG